MWLYRLQQRLSITRVEGNVLLVIAFLLLLGVGVQQYQSTPPALPEGIYDEVDEAFDEARVAADPPGQEVQPPDGAMAGSEESQGPSVAINSATSIELQQLPGIGPALAQRIMTYREEHGDFRKVDELTDVRGIGPRTLEGLKDYVVLDRE